MRLRGVTVIYLHHDGKDQKTQRGHSKPEDPLNWVIGLRWAEIENDGSMTGAEKHLAWSRWMKLEMDLRGTAAPTKSIHATVKGPQLDALYLDIRQELLHLSEEDKHQALLLMREFARSRKKPVVVTTKFISEGNHDVNLVALHVVMLLSPTEYSNNHPYMSSRFPEKFQPTSAVEQTVND